MASLITRTAVRPAIAGHMARTPQLSARTAVYALNFQKKFIVRAAAAEAEAVETEDVEEAAIAAPSAQEARLAALEAAEHAVAEDPEFSLNFLWLEKNIAVAVDQVFKSGRRAPVTEYFFWPRKDAWEELKASLEGKTWVGEREKVLLLNRCTEVINYWQDENKHSVAEVREKFADCFFQG